MRKKIIIAVVMLLLGAAVVFGVVRNTPEDNVIKWQMTVKEGETLTHTIKACDPNGQRYEGNFIIIVASQTPEGLALSPSYPICTEGDCEPTDPICDTNTPCIVYGADLVWTPTHAQGGQKYRVLITCMDKAQNSDNKWFEITVLEVDNVPPFLLAD